MKTKEQKRLEAIKRQLIHCLQEEYHLKNEKDDDLIPFRRANLNQELVKLNYTVGDNCVVLSNFTEEEQRFLVEHTEYGKYRKEIDDYEKIRKNKIYKEPDIVMMKILSRFD